MVTYEPLNITPVVNNERLQEVRPNVPKEVIAKFLEEQGDHDYPGWEPEQLVFAQDSEQALGVKPELIELVAADLDLYFANL